MGRAAAPFGLILAALNWACDTGRSPSDDRPSIVLIMADDMGFSDLGSYGGEIRTPHLDRLSADGLRFTQFYNAARCCPTRASLLTGLYPHQAGVGHMVQDLGTPAYQGRLNDQCVTIAEVLGQAGYQTFMAGKWHVTPFDYSPQPQLDVATWPTRRGFDRFFGTLAGAGSYYAPVSLMEQESFIEAPPDFYYTDAISDFGVRAIESAGSGPLFLYVAHVAPHWPLHAPADDVSRNVDSYGAGWDEIRSRRHRRQLDAGLAGDAWRLTERDPLIPAWQDAPDREWEAHRMAVRRAGGADGYRGRQDPGGAGSNRAASEHPDSLPCRQRRLCRDHSGDGDPPRALCPGWNPSRDPARRA